MSTFDAVTLEVIWNRMIASVDEAAKAIVRTSFSTLSNEANDFACVLTDAEGQLLAQNSGSIPSFIGTLPATVRHTLERFGPDGLVPGDVICTNDPWLGTGHLNDVSVVRPIFRGDNLIAFAATASHMPDIGGRIRSVEAREIFEEGFHIPLLKIFRAGEPDQTFFELLRTQVRTPDQTEGDIHAQITANYLIEDRVLAMVAEYGLDDLVEL
ncbi:MAG: hydantoinase B/oxoprolinase family protein, partial [Rhodospirillaceae bacterium]|nr:hydantoinase B/oxoprolinase family protein [Rhodospirillaceae bacterium]